MLGWVRSVGRFARLRARPELPVGFAVIYTLHALGFAIPGNIWVFVCLLFGGAAISRTFAGWRTRQAEPPPWTARVEIMLQLALLTMLLWLSGWAPLLYVGYVVFVAIRLNELGGAWRFTLFACLGAMTLLQGGIALGLVSSYLKPMTAQVAGILAATCVALAIRVLGANANARAAAEAEAEASEERFRTVVQDSWDVIVITDADGKMTFVSAAVQKVMGWDEDEYRALPDAIRYHPEDGAAARGIPDALAAGAAEHRTEVRLRHGDGTYHWHEILVRNLLDHPSVRGVVFNHRDITARKQREDALTHQATHDPLTGLANRTALRDRLNAWCASEQPVPGAVLFVDLDGFKLVNDGLGHAAGDEVLTTTARVLRECVGAGDTVARLGGDEFAVLLTGVASEQEAIEVADRVIKRLGGADCVAEIQASVGIAMCEPGRLGAREALHRADQAMYDAKRIGDHGWILYRDLDDVLGQAVR